MSDSTPAIPRRISIAHLFRLDPIEPDATRAADVAGPPAWRTDPEARADFDERAAVLEYDGGRPRAEAEAAARVEIEAVRRGVAPVEIAGASDDRRRGWADLDDAQALLAFLREHNPRSYGAAARALGWGATRAWQAEARLRAAGLVRHLRPTGKAEAVSEASA